MTTSTEELANQAKELNEMISFFNVNEIKKENRTTNTPNRINLLHANTIRVKATPLYVSINKK